MRFAGNQGGRSCAEKFGLGRKYQPYSVAIYTLFGNLWANEVLWGQKQCFLGKKRTTTWYILHM